MSEWQHRLNPLMAFFRIVHALPAWHHTHAHTHLLIYSSLPPKHARRKENTDPASANLTVLHRKQFVFHEPGSVWIFTAQDSRVDRGVTSTFPSHCFLLGETTLAVQLPLLTLQPQVLSPEISGWVGNTVRGCATCQSQWGRGLMTTAVHCSGSLPDPPLGLLEMSAFLGFMSPSNC